MTSVAAILSLGFVLGMRHATDPDHVVAVTTIVSRQRGIRAAGLVGAVWGLGHTATLLIVGGAILLFNVVVPPRLGLGLELCVALMLIALGLTNLSRAGRAAAHDHDHDHQNGTEGIGLRGAQMVRSLAVGIVHGLAGSAAVALLVLATIRDPGEALLYLGLFGAGTIVGMLLITSLVAAPFAYAAERFGRVHLVMARVVSVASVGFGLFLGYRIGIVDGLFSQAPHWTPE